MMALFSLALQGLGGREGFVMEDSETSNAFVVKQQPEKHTRCYTLSDARGLIRVCSTRSQRVLPSCGTKYSKGGERSFGVYKPGCWSVRNLCGGFYRLLAAPLRSVASCDYYVIALRHIIR